MMQPPMPSPGQPDPGQGMNSPVGQMPDQGLGAQGGAANNAQQQGMGAQPGMDPAILQQLLNAPPPNAGGNWPING